MYDSYDDDNFYDEEDLNSGNVLDESKTEVGEGGVTLPSSDGVESKNPGLGSAVDEVVDEASLAKTITMNFGDLDISVEDDPSNPDDGDVFTPEERLRMFSDQVISCCFSSDRELANYAVSKLLSSINPRLFRDENYVLFSVLYNYRDKIRRINIDEEFLKLYLNRNRGLLVKSRGLIDINAYGEVDGSVELGYISGVIKSFRRLKAMEPLSVPEFETAFEKYLIEFKAIEASKIYAQSDLILKEGLRVGNKMLVGFEDSFNYSRRKLAEIEGLVDIQKGSGFVTMNEVLREEKDDGKKPYKISDFDRLEALNKVYGGIYTGTFYEVIAPPKAGKSKLCARICHTTAVKYGNNVTVWPAEGGKDAWTAQMRAIHFDYTYNTGVGVTERKYGVDQDAILHDRFPNNELKELELSSKIDLDSNQDYGIIEYIDRPFEVETFLEDIDASVKQNNSKLIIIDYLQLIGTSGNVTERERISDAYIRLLRYCRANNVGVICPAQYKQEAFNELLAKADTSSADLRTSGGGSSEVLRTPDIIFALWATTQDLQNNRMKILSMPCRFNKAYPEIPVNMDLGPCQFISVD